MFLDPTGTISVALPPGWAFDLSSTLTDLCFADWATPGERQMFVRAVAPHAPAAAIDGEWEAAVRRTLPAEATRVDQRGGRLVLVERPGRDGRPDQRWAIARGPRLDVVIEQVGVPLGGALATPELGQVLRSLDVPVNRHLAEGHAEAAWQNAMRDAAQAYQGRDSAAAARHLGEARRVAREDWLHSLTGSSAPGVAGAMAEAEAALRLAEVVRSVAILRQATLTLLRVRRSLTVDPDPSPELLQHNDSLLRQALQMHGAADDGDVPDGPLGACLTRARLLVREIDELLRSGEPEIGRALADVAVEDAMTVALYARRGPATVPAEVAANLAAQGVTDPAAQREHAHAKLEIVALDHLTSAGAALQAASAHASLNADRAVTANWVLAARRLTELSPSPERQTGLASALAGHASALIALGDEPSLVRAQDLIAEAETVADAVKDDALRAQILLIQGSLRHTRRDLEGSAEVLEEAIAAAQRSGAGLFERAARSLRSQFLTNSGRHEEAVAEARAALAVPEDPAASSHHLNLAIALLGADRHEEALAEVQIGLVHALRENPLGDVALRLLFVAASLLERDDPTASLAATEAAEAILDAVRLRVGDAADRVAYDDAVRHRQVAATLVQRRLAVGDVLGALATADRHRARSLVRGGAGRTDAWSLLPDRTEHPPPPAEGAPLSEQVDYVTARAREALSRHRVPPPLGGAALADAVAASGRTALVFHPTGDELVAFVVHPGPPARVEAGVAARSMPDIVKLVDALRAQLGVVLAARAARGVLPPIPLDDLVAALADDEELDEADAELGRLRRELHDALLSEVLPLLTEGEPLVVVPYRELAVVPLPVLQGSAGRLLAERHPLSVLPSLASLDALRPAGADQGRGVVVGDPQLDPRHGLTPLAGAAEEAEHVTQALRTAGFATTPLMRGAATEEAFRQSSRGARVVHLACHAALRDPASASALFLTPAPPDDGMLLPAEIAELGLDGALVVLAACQSGLGRATADGVLGLGRAFVSAGARAVVLSLWRVDDYVTAQLMRELYDGLLGNAAELDGPLDVAAALRRAQLCVRENVSSDPSAWGPWLLVGDGGVRLA